MFTRWKARVLALALIGAATTFVPPSPAGAATKTCDKGEFCVYGNDGKWWVLLIDEDGNWKGEKKIINGQVWNNGTRHPRGLDHIEVVVTSGGQRLKTCLHYGPAKYDHETDEPTQRALPNGILRSVTWRGECGWTEDDDWERF